MNTTVIGVPKGIRYMSQWEDYSLKDFPHIVDKQIPGCGFTEYCLTNSDNIILCSPRKILLENKEEQHSGDVYLVKSLYKDLGVDKDLEKKAKPVLNLDKIEEENAKARELAEREYRRIEMDLENYWVIRNKHNLPCKILVTYDSFRKVKETLAKFGILDMFHVVVDEFQSIFVDSKFKPDTEMDFLKSLQDIQKLCYVSATPMIETYLDRLDEFKDLPYYKLDWSMYDTNRVIKPSLVVRSLKSVKSVAKKIIESYKSGNFSKLPRTNKDTGKLEEVESKEAVIYVNSVSNLTQIIKDNDLRPEEVNILCANTEENLNKIKKTIGKEFQIGKVPTKGEQHKMFTFCTRTVYLGADFYSTNARTFIISDANVDTLAVDITLDLPQILGRQRLIDNPWKNKATLYVKTLTAGNKVSIEKFKERLNNKKVTTESLLRSFESAPDPIAKHCLAVKFLKDAINSKYVDDYVSVNKHAGKDLVPVYNILALVSEERAFEIQQLDYADRFTVFNRIDQAFANQALLAVEREVEHFMDSFNNIEKPNLKMKFLCEAELSNTVRAAVLDRVPEYFCRFYLVLGPERCRAAGYGYSRMKSELEIETFDKDKLQERIYSEFNVGDKITCFNAKIKLKDIYSDLEYNKVAKANDLSEWFELKEIKLTNPETKKRDMAFELLKKKN